MAKPAKVVVVGEGTATGVPDRCIVHMTLNWMADTVEDAVSRIAAVASGLTESLDAAGIDSADIRTTSVRVHEVFDRDSKKVTGHGAAYHLELTVRELEKLGEFLTTMVCAAGDLLRIQGLQLTIADPEPLLREARARAMRDAGSKAAQLAKSAGGHLGRIVSIEEGIAPGLPSHRVTRKMAASAEAAVPDLQIEPGSQDVRCSVTVTYELSRSRGAVTESGGHR